MIDSNGMDTIERIAKVKLGVNSFAKSDPRRLQLYIVAIWDIQSALEAAYESGRQAEIRRRE